MTSTSASSDTEAPDGLATIAAEAATLAADHIRPLIGNVAALATKSSPTDVVTQVDIEAEALIRTALQQATPGARILAEESGMSGGDNDDARHATLEWIVDPLDGTVNFLYGLPVVAVSIAAAVDGRVVAGAVVDVLRNEVFAASAGNGATVDGTPITTSSCTALSSALILTGYSYDAALRAEHGQLVQRLLPAARDIRCFGSAALHCCWVGAGRVEGYIERDIKVWDYSAGALIAAEAGAHVELPCPENDDLVTIAAPGIVEELRALI